MAIFLARCRPPTEWVGSALPTHSGARRRAGCRSPPGSSRLVVSFLRLGRRAGWGGGTSGEFPWAAGAAVIEFDPVAIGVTHMEVGAAGFQGLPEPDRDQGRSEEH